ncbi:MAG: hypothetical protein OEX12_13265 [Gammaproteobacteria bacterium]|nr:hypothetical protein [Gammaproteobacteria bacterium]
MAWESGVAANYVDLLHKFHKMVTSHADLVTASQTWTLLKNTNLSETEGRWGFSDLAAVGTDKAYFEVTIDRDTSMHLVTIGVDQLRVSNAGESASGFYGVDSAGYIHTNGVKSGTALFGAFGAGDVIMVAHDFNTDEVWVGKNGVWYNSGVPNTNTFPTFSLPVDLTVYPAVDHRENVKVTWNFGATAFTYTPPTGYSGKTTSVIDPVNSHVDVIISGLVSEATHVGGGMHYYQAHGLAGTDVILSRFWTYKNAPADEFNLRFDMADSFISEPLSWVNPSSEGSIMLWEGSIPYWFIVNGRRAIIVARVAAGTYETAYVGWYMPYATPTEHPAPAYIGGSYPDYWTRYSVNDWYHRSFWDPSLGSAYVREYNGNWLEVSNWYVSSGTEYKDALTSNRASIHPYYDIQSRYVRPCYGPDTYWLSPVTLFNAATSGEVLGELDGVKCVSGFGNAAENTITEGADTYLVVSQSYLTRVQDYAALLLE